MAKNNGGHNGPGCVVLIVAFIFVVGVLSGISCDPFSKKGEEIPRSVEYEVPR